MRSRSAGLVMCLAFLAGVHSWPARAADPPRRKPLSQDERAAVLDLIRAVDVAQDTDVTSPDAARWNSHVLKSRNETAYVPFRLTLNALPDGFKSAVMYVRAVTRHDGLRAKDERSAARDWLQRGSSVPPRVETVFVGPGEMPIGGPGVGSTRRAISGPAEASAVLTLQQREAERQTAAADAAKKKSETKERDPFLFPFEDYYVTAIPPSRGSVPPTLERALALPAGEYDVYVAMIDRGRLKTSGPVIVRHTVTVPDFWNDDLALSSLILAADVNTLKAPLPAQQQSEHPYTFGRAEVVPAAAVFAPNDVLSVVYQICNYGAPDSDLMAEYNFYRTDDGPRRLFNRTEPQQFSDTDLPAPAPWETVAFATQAIPLQTFPKGRYELEVIVRDRLTRRSASRTTAFEIVAR